MKNLLISLVILMVSGTVYSAVVVEPSSLTTIESGSAIQYRIYLDSTPSAGETVTITPSSNDVTEGTVSGAINFDTLNYQQHQYITVTPGASGDGNDGDVSYNINNQVASNQVGGNYDGEMAASVNVSNTNIDGNAVITVDPSSGFYVLEGSNQIITFSAGPDVSPQNDISINLSTVSTDITLSVNTVTLNAGNSYSSSVTVTAVDDMVVNGDVPFTIITAPAVSGDPSYDGFNPVDIIGMRLENDNSSFNLDIDVSGLAATNSVSFMNGVDTLTVNTDGTNTISTLANGAPYSVSITAQPNTPNQSCQITSGNASGNIGGSDETITVVCTTISYTIGGNVSGLSGGNSVELQNNLTDNITVNANGGFVFPTALLDETNYSVTVLTQPAGQTCLLSNNTGTLGGGDVSDVNIACSTQSIGLDVSSIDFGHVFSGDIQSGVITVTNTGAVNTSITGVNQPSLPFSLSGGSCLAFPVVLTPGSDCTFDVSFTPTTEGTFNGQFDILSTSASSPDVVTLLGSSAIRSVPSLSSWGLMLLVLTVLIITNSRKGIKINS